LAENALAVIDAVQRAKPPTAKGRYVGTIHITATMTPSIQLDVLKYVRM
jgi:large subunit ribosomal protein L1